MPTVTADGKKRELPAKTTIVLHSGDAVIIYTAGGGGYGMEAYRYNTARERDIADQVEVAELLRADDVFREPPP